MMHKNGEKIPPCQIMEVLVVMVEENGMQQKHRIGKISTMAAEYISVCK